MASRSMATKNVVRDLRRLIDAAEKDIRREATRRTRDEVEPLRLALRALESGEARNGPTPTPKPRKRRKPRAKTARDPEATRLVQDYLQAYSEGVMEAQIRTDTGLSKSTVSKILERLEDGNLARPEPRERKRGTPRKWYSTTERPIGLPAGSGLGNGDRVPEPIPA